MGELSRYVNYREYKAVLDRELEKTAEGFVKIGYLLRIAEDTDILKESGYKNVNEFAKAEYNLDPSRVSRFIDINKKFAEGGYSDKLMDQYRGFGYAKLSIMLLLPEEINSVITPNYSKSEIQAIRNEIEAERKTSDLEVIAEGEDISQQEMDLIHKVLHQLGHDDPELYQRLHVTAQKRKDAKGFLDILAPAGEGVKSVRIKGTGRVMMAIKGIESEVSIVNTRTNEKENVAWQQLIDAIVDLLNLKLSSKDSWEALYKETWPIREKSQIAPVQEAKKTDRVTPAKSTEKPVKAKPAFKETKTKVEKKPAVIPEPEEMHQVHIEEIPEALPEGYIKSHEGIEVEINPETKHWNKVGELMQLLQSEMNSETKDLEYMISTADLIKMTLEEIKAVRMESNECSD